MKFIVYSLIAIFYGLIASVIVGCSTFETLEQNRSVAPSNQEPEAPEGTISEEEDESSQDKGASEIDYSLQTGQWVQTVAYDEVEVDVIIDRPEVDTGDVLILFHGTAGTDDKILNASQLILDNTKRMLGDREVLYVSVVYPEEDLLFGDNLKYGESAVNWVKEKMSNEMGFSIKKQFMIGHSRWIHGN